MRVAVVDIGTNSTRLLIADVDGGSLEEVERRSTVTRLGEGVDATGDSATRRSSACSPRSRSTPRRSPPTAPSGASRS